MLVEMANQEEPIKSHSVFATGLAALGPASHFRSSAPADDMQRQVIASVVGKRARRSRIGAVSAIARLGAVLPAIRALAVLSTLIRQARPSPMTLATGLIRAKHGWTIAVYDCKLARCG